MVLFKRMQSLIAVLLLDVTIGQNIRPVRPVPVKQDHPQQYYDFEPPKVDPPPVGPIKEEVVLKKLEKELAPLGPSYMPVCKTYSMSNYAENYSGNSYVNGCFSGSCFHQAEWGHHALQWKHYAHKAGIGFPANVWATYDENIVETYYPPWQWVRCEGGNFMDHLVLDYIEGHPHGPFQNLGNVVDPPGTWQCQKEPNALRGAILAAMAAHYWGSPSYINIQATDSATGFEMYVAAIEKVTLCSLTGNQPPDVVCRWNQPWNSGSANLASCANNVVLHSVEISWWRGYSPASPWFVPHQTYSPVEWNAMYSRTAPNGQVFDYLIWDPPTEMSEEAVKAMRTTADNTIQKMLIIEEDEKGNKQLVDAEKLKG